jgi:hypothetical protein
LAAVAGQVYSVEAIAERLEFCRIRLEQESIQNVQLVQATALDLPFADGFFDVIVVNGILEWVGEWERSGEPRSVQTKFLMGLHRMLKANGKLVIGIENRFGYELLRGAKDHSGVAYTSLMPRWLASLYLKIDKTPHHRMLLNPRREYRTYTYSKSGYRKLLAESGFSSSEFYWADPGYNQPYTLIPVPGPFVRRHFRRKQYGLQSSRRGWRRVAARLATHAMPFLVPDFLIFAQKDELSDSGISTLPSLSDIRGARYCLYTNPFCAKTVIWAFDSRKDAPRLIVKTCNGTQTGPTSVEAEHAVLSLVSEKLKSRKIANWTVPVPGPRCRVGNNVFVTESVAAGRQMSELFSGQSHHEPGRLALELERCSDVAVELANLLLGEPCIPQPDEKDWRVPPEFKNHWDLQPLIEQARSRRRPGPRWVQHGDFTIENIFLDSATNGITLVDWEQTTSGVTPLYDIFSLLMSALPLANVWQRGSESTPSSLQRSFLEAFFGEGAWAEMFKRLLSKACQRLAVPQDEVWQHLLEFLVLRINLFARKSAEMEIEHRQFLLAVLQHRGNFLIPFDNEAMTSVVNVK